MVRFAALLLLSSATGCAEISGLTEFEPEGSGGGGAGTGTGGTGGNGAGTGGEAGGVLSSDCPDDVELARGPFGQRRAVAELNTDQDEDDPSFTADGLELYFNREDTEGTRRVFKARRDDIDDVWRDPVMVVEVNLTGLESNVVVSPDGLTLWMHDGSGNVVSRRPSRSDAWSAPVPDEQLPTSWLGLVNAVTCDQLHLLASDDQNLYETSRASSSSAWATVTPVIGLGSDVKKEAWMSFDGRTVYWAWGQTMYRGKRPGPGADFAGFEVVQEVSGKGQIMGDPWLDATQRYMMYAVGTGARDLFEARR